MAGSATPYGFRPTRHLTGGEIRAGSYPIASAYGTNIFYGDICRLLNTGTIDKAASAGSPGTTAIGIFAGCRSSTFAYGWKPYYPATTTASDLVAFVYDDPNIVFVANGGSGAGNTTLPQTQTAVGLNVQFQPGTGSTVTGMSGAYLDLGTLAVTATFPFRVLNFYQTPANEMLVLGATGTSDAFPDMEVGWNVHLNKQATGI